MLTVRAAPGSSFSRMPFISTTMLHLSYKQSAALRMLVLFFAALFVAPAAPAANHATGFGKQTYLFDLRHSDAFLAPKAERERGAVAGIAASDPCPPGFDFSDTDGALTQGAAAATRAGIAPAFAKAWQERPRPTQGAGAIGARAPPSIQSPSA